MLALTAAAALALSPRAAAGTSALEQLRGLAPAEAAAPATPAARALPSARTAPAPRLDTAAAVSRLCSSPDPVLIVDTFVSERVEPAIDVDGDGRPDFEHGDVLAALYGSTGRAYRTLDLRGVRHFPHVADTFEAIAADVESGRLRVAAINLSHAVDVSWEGLNADLALARPAGPGDIESRREELLRGVLALMERNEDPDFARLAAATARLAARGVPVLVVAGNHTAKKVNLLGLLPGALSVGALARDGRKAAFSADNSLVAAWARGEHVFRRVAGGLDVNEDGRADVPSSRLSGGPMLASRFAGRPLAEVRGKLPTDPWLDNLDRRNANGLKYLQDQMEDKLYTVEELVGFFRVSPLKARSFASRGRWFDKTMQYPFDVDASGRVVFDPERSGAPGQALLVPGTSFSPPALCWGGARVR